jgi:hypothetical protein
VQATARPLQIVDFSTPGSDFPQRTHSACFSPVFSWPGPLIHSGNRSEKADEIQIAFVVDIRHEKAVQNLSKTRSKLENIAYVLCE